MFHPQTLNFNRIWLPVNDFQKTSAKSVWAQPVLFTVFMDLGYQMRKRQWVVKANMAPVKYGQEYTSKVQL